jgi:3-phosphoshikimate 1-carboxyvinyltransferase
MIKIKKLEQKFNIVIDEIASDKSISHRCAIFSLLSDKPSIIKNYLQAEDTLNSLKICELLGANVEKDKEYILSLIHI